MQNSHCPDCGEELEGWRADEEWPHCDFDGNDVCEECQRDHEQICPVCQDRIFNEMMSAEIIAVNKELALDQKMKSGFYRVLEKPFFRAALVFGFESFQEGALEYLKPIPRKVEIDVSGFICQECTTKYELISIPVA